MPKSPAKLVKEFAEKQSIRAIEVLTEVMDDDRATGATRIQAANAILDRAFGKPVQGMDMTSSDGSMTPKGMDAFYAVAAPAHNNAQQLIDDIEDDPLLG